MQPLRDTRDKANYTPEQCRAVPWFNIDGDKTLRLNYKLNTDSIVYDVGGYEGAWAADIYHKYECNIEIFEPVRKFADKIETRFASKSKIHIHAFGLAEKNYQTTIKLDGASSTTHKTAKRGEKIRLIRARDFINERGYKKVDLMKINIEGGEYPLLAHLIQTGLIKNIENIQVQFHAFVADAPKKRQKLHEKLSKTHYLTYSYPWLWENWRRKK